MLCNLYLMFIASVQARYPRCKALFSILFDLLPYGDICDWKALALIYRQQDYCYLFGTQV